MIKPLRHLLPLLSLALLLTGCTGLFAPTDPRPPEELAAKAEELIKFKAYAGAIELYAKAIAKQPGNGRYYLRRSELLEALGRDKEARANYRDGLDGLPGNAPELPEIRHRLAVLSAEHLQDIDTAEDILKQLPGGSGRRLEQQLALGVAGGAGDEDLVGLGDGAVFIANLLFILLGLITFALRGFGTGLILPRAAPGRPADRVYQACGIYESLIYYNRSLYPLLQDTGMTVRFTEVRDGHNWENWRDRLREAVIGPDPQESSFVWYAGQGGNGVFADVGEELVAEALTLRRALHEAADVDHLHRGVHEGLRLRHRAEPVDALVGHLCEGDGGLGGGEGVRGDDGRDDHRPAHRRRSACR